MAQKKRPSLKDIAQAAGVSPAAVSAVVNNKSGGSIRVSPSTRQRVLEAMQELGYVAHPAAKILAGGRNDIIAVFTYEAIFPFATRNFYYPFLQAIEQEAERHGQDLLLVTSASAEDGSRSIYRNGLNRLRLADGAILLGLRKNEDEMIRLINEEFPVVIVGHRELPGVEPSFVGADYTAATKTLVEMLLNKGHKSIMFLGVPDSGEPGKERIHGYIEAMQAAALPYEDKLVTITPETLTSNFLRERLGLGDTAFVTESFSIAESLASVAENMNLDIPQDFSIVVLGGPHENPKHNINWTTLVTPAQQMGTQAYRMLIELLHNPDSPPLQKTLDCDILEGATIAEPPRPKR